MATIATAHDEFYKAQRAGQKNYRECLARGQYPYLQVLDDILQNTDIEVTEPLGLVDIPAERIVGTKTAGRTKAFARNFMPLLDARTEFGTKWISLCKAQMNEGIRDPIRVFEFMNRFYVQEGNKRVSVLKHFDSPSILGYVTRLVPPRTDDLENRIYYEFLAFYKVTGLNCIWFSDVGRFAKLVELAGQAPGAVWDGQARLELVSLYRCFYRAFMATGGGNLSITPSDALLAYLNVYGYRPALDKTETEIRTDLVKVWKEVLVLTENEAVTLSMEPAGAAPKGFAKLFAAGPERLQVAFLYEKSALTSAWTYAHELGRAELQDTYPGRVDTRCYDNVRVGEDDDAILEQAIADGADVVFTTTPKLMPASLRAKVRHPQVKILNCSLNMAHPDIRTYYGRIHEAKFLVGAIAGAIADDNKIGYVATYPTRGMTAGINAFALGAKMVNPRARIYLEWTAVKGSDPAAAFAGRGVEIISNLDMQAPENNSPRFGLYRLEDGQPHNFAMPYWQWGRFYTRIVESIFTGSWKNSTPTPDTRAINYWWGMSAGVVDVVCSRSIPADITRLVELLRTAICHSEFEPFYGLVRGQNGEIHGAENQRMTPEEIIHMDWLADNVEGRLPEFDELIDEAKPLVRLQGVGREKL